MRSTADSPLLLHNTMRVRPGHVEQYKAAVRRAVEFVEEHGPQIMVQVFIDEERLEAHSFQLYPDSDSTAGRRLRTDPVGLLWHVAERTPPRSADRCETQAA